MSRFLSSNDFTSSNYCQYQSIERPACSIPAFKAQLLLSAWKIENFALIQNNLSAFQTHSKHAFGVTQLTCSFQNLKSIFYNNLVVIIRLQSAKVKKTSVVLNGHIQYEICISFCSEIGDNHVHLICLLNNLKVSVKIINLVDRKTQLFKSAEISLSLSYNTGSIFRFCYG